MIQLSLCLFGLLLFVSTGVIAQHPPAISVPGSSNAATGGATVTRHGKAVVCYVASWAVYRPEPGKFDLEHLEGGLDGCSHLVYSFAGLNPNSSALRSLDPYRDLEENFGKGTYRRMTGLRRRYPHLKVTLAVGGWNEGSTNYSAMASSPHSRSNFVKSAMDFISNYDFDGLDLDWEYPGKRGGKPEDKKNFVALVRELREAFNSRGWILTSAIGAGKDVMEIAYDVRALAPHMDLFHLMCYDYHGSWDGRTGHNAPLHQSLQATQENDKFFTTEYSVKYLLELGAPASKIVMGVPMYGRTFLLKEEPVGKGAVIPGMPTKDKGFQGPFTKEDGFMGYNEICLELMDTGNGSSDEGWQLGWDETSKVPYATKGEKWFSYDNEVSIREKVLFAMELDLAGIMVWSIDTDDFRGDCKNEKEGSHKKFPLLHAINEAIQQAISQKENVIPDDKEMPDSGSVSFMSIPMSLTVLTFISLLISRLSN